MAAPYFEIPIFRIERACAGDSHCFSRAYAFSAALPQRKARVRVPNQSEIASRVRYSQTAAAMRFARCLRPPTLIETASVLG